MKPYTILKGLIKVPLIAHIPHASLFIPSELRPSLLIDNEALKGELLLLTDRYADELFSCIYEIGGISFICNFSRMIVDVERFEDDQVEMMSKKGMGAVYTKTSRGMDLRVDIRTQDGQTLIERFYRPYHEAFEQEVQNLLALFEECLIMDCHSFSSNPLPFELDQDPQRPDICIGTDSFHTPPRLIETIEEFSNRTDLRISFNKPYEGTYVPLKYLGIEKRVSSVMIEINRKLYMDENTGEKLSAFNQMKEVIEGVVKAIIPNMKV